MIIKEWFYEYFKMQRKRTYTIGCLTKGYEGIYEEIAEAEIPKEFKDVKLAGSGNLYKDYYRSNTKGITFGKCFKKVADRISFKPLQHEKLEHLNDDILSNENKIAIIESVADLSDNVSVSICNELNQKNEMDISFRIKNDDLQPIAHDFEEYSEAFIGRDKFDIRLEVLIDSAEKNLLNKRKLKLGEILDFIKKDISKVINISYRNYEDNYFYGKDIYRG